MEMKFIYEFVPTGENKIDPKLEKLLENLVEASTIIRDLSVIERNFDTSRAIDEVIDSVCE